MVEEKTKRITTSGKRKAAVARAIISPGKGEVFVNKKNYKTLQRFDKLKLEEPLRIVEKILGSFNFNVQIYTKGGGEKSQIEAARVALSRAILEFTKSKELEKAFLAYDRNLIVADIRRKEAYKPGDSKARAKRQSSKR